MLLIFPCVSFSNRLFGFFGGRQQQNLHEAFYAVKPCEVYYKISMRVFDLLFGVEVSILWCSAAAVLVVLSGESIESLNVSLEVLQMLLMSFTWTVLSTRTALAGLLIALLSCKAHV